jgi:hypothetical protein
LFCFLFVIGLAARAEAARLRLSVPVHGVSHVAFYAATIPILARALKIKEDAATKIYDAALPGMVADGSINEEIQRRVIDDTRQSPGMKEPVSADKVFRFSLVHKINAELKVQGWKP